MDKRDRRTPRNIPSNISIVLDAHRSGRPIVMLDGCPLHCGRHTLARHSIEPDLHWDLSRMGVSKRKHEDFSPADATRLEPQLAEETLRARVAD